MHETTKKVRAYYAAVVRDAVRAAYSKRMGESKRYSAGWDEKDHPRDEAGRFTPKELGYRAATESHFQPWQSKNERKALLQKHGLDPSVHTNEYMVGWNQGMKVWQAKSEAKLAEKIAPYMDEAREIVTENAEADGIEVDEAKVRELAYSLANEAEEEQDREREELAIRNREMVEHQIWKDAMIESRQALFDYCKDHGYKCELDHESLSGNSHYYSVGKLDEDGDIEALLKVRISDHIAKSGAGFNQGTGEHYDEPDVNFLLRLPDKAKSFLDKVDHDTDWFDYAGTAEAKQATDGISSQMILSKIAKAMEDL